jgi:hypothetical protein
VPKPQEPKPQEPQPEVPKPPAIEILSASWDTDYYYDRYYGMYIDVLLCEIKTNVAMERLELRWHCCNNTTLFYIEKSGNSNLDLLYSKRSSDKKTWEFDIDDISDGRHVLAIRAYDEKGNVSAWKSINITI